MTAKMIDGEQIMWMRLEGNADAMHMLQTSHAFWVGHLLSWANSKSLRAQYAAQLLISLITSYIRHNCLRPPSPLKTYESWREVLSVACFWAGGWAYEALIQIRGWRPQQGFFQMLKEIDEESTTSEHDTTAKAEIWFSYIGKESQGTALNKDIAIRSEGLC